MVVLAPEQSVISTPSISCEHGIGKAPVHLLIMQPVLRPKGGTRVRDMAKRPHSFVGEPFVVAFVLLVGQPDASQCVTWQIRWYTQAIRFVHGLPVGIPRTVCNPGPITRH